MKDLWLYLRARHWHIALWAINWALFALMARLGGMGAENVAYTALLSAVCALAVGAADCRQFLKKHRLLQDICRQTRLAASSLPECGANALEQDYQALVRALESDMAAAVSRTDRKMADLAAYYTLWAHQIKTPIAAMRLLLQQDGQENSELGQELFRIEQYVEMALGYVRLDSESTDLLLRRYPLDEVIRPAVRKFAPQFIHKRLTLRYEPGTQTALTDEKWLGFVIEQVLSNAVKYTPVGGTVTISCTDAPAIVISARIRAGLYRLQRPRGQKGHRSRALSLPPRLPQARPYHHHALARGRGHRDHDQPRAHRAHARMSGAV